MEDTISPEKWI